jgi:hypothetical protein
MSDFTFSPDPSPTLPDKPLSAPEVHRSLVGGTVGYKGSQTVEGVKFGFGLTDKGAIEAYNSKDDKDEDAVIGPIPDNKNDFEVVLDPQIKFTENNAWLKYRFEGGINVSAEATISPIGLKLDNSVLAVFADYHCHTSSENTRNAVISDLQNLRFAARTEDIFALSENEALSYQVRGELSASITLSWSDVFTSNLSALTRLLRSGKMLAIEIDAGASVKLDLGVVDDFHLIFSKLSNGEIRLAIKKSDSKSLGVSASLGVTAKIANSADLIKALSSVAQGIIGQPVALIDEILNKASLADLNDQERAILTEVLNQLGFGDLLETIGQIKSKWEAFKKQVSDTVEKIVKTKVELGFTFDYLRVQTDETLLIARLSEASVTQFHDDLMICEIRHLLDWLKSHPEGLEKYLNQTTIERSRAWGFSLSLGDFKVSGKDTVDLKQITQRNLTNDEVRISLEGKRGYIGKLGNDSAQWLADFKAQMPRFSKNPIPTVCEFDFGLYLKWTWEEKTLSLDELTDYLDYAVLWRALTLDHVAEAVAKVGPRINQKAQVSLELKIENEPLKKLVKLLSNSNGDDLAAHALAKAMPYMKAFDARRNPKFRDLCYYPMWRHYLEHDDLTPDECLGLARKTILKVTQLDQIPGGSDLANREGGIGLGPSDAPYEDIFTFAGQVFYNGDMGHDDDYSGIHRSWEHFLDGLKALDGAFTHCLPHSVLNDALKKLNSFWSQSLFLRAAGVCFVDIAAINGDLLAQLERNLTITFADGTVLTIASAV